MCLIMCFSTRRLTKTVIAPASDASGAGLPA